MKKSLELKELRSDLVSNLENVHDLATSEKRELSKDEKAQVDGYISEIDNLDNDIKRAEKVEAEIRKAASVSGQSVIKPKMDKRYSIQKAINESINGGLTGLEKEYDQEARLNNNITGIGIPYAAMETRTNPQLVSDTGAKVIATEVGDVAPSLQNKTVLGDLATWMYGLSGDMKLPTMSSTTAGFTADDGITAATDAATAFTSSTLQPRKLNAYMDISKMLLQQTNGSVERLIRNDIENAMMSVLEANILGANDGTGAPPKGVFSAGTESGTTGGAAASRARVLAQIQALEEANADFGNVAFLCNPEMKAKLLSIAGDVVATSGVSRPILENGEMFGIPVHVTPGVQAAASGSHTLPLVLGKFDDLVIGQFGSALDVVVDPYSLAITGEVRLVVLSYWDAIYRRATSFQYNYNS